MIYTLVSINLMVEFLFAFGNHESFVVVGVLEHANTASLDSIFLF